MNPKNQSSDDSKALQERAEERMLETCLTELLGAETAPDLSREILRQHERRRSNGTSTPQTSGKPRLSVHYLANMAAALLISLTILLLFRPHTQLQAAELHIQILRGTISFYPDDGNERHTTLGAGFHILLLLPGIRIQTSSLESDIALDQWGRLELAPHTTIEFKTRETLTMNGKTIASSVLLGVVAGTATWFGLDQTSVVSAGSAIEVGSKEDKVDLVARFEKRERELLEENQRLKKQVLELQSEDQRTEVSITKTMRETPEEEPIAMKIAAPVFTSPEYAEALAKVDWTVMGESMEEMLPLLAQLLTEYEETGEANMKLGGQIQALNGKLLQELPALIKGGVPGSGGNGTFTHPLVVSNQVNALLKAAGIPLDERQVARLKALSSAYSTEDEVQRLSSAKDDFSIAAVIAETGVKDRYYEDLRATLSPEQIKRLYPEALKGRTGSDLFSTGLVWTQYARPVRASGPAELQKRISDQFTRGLGLDAAQSKKLDGLVSKWARDFPAGFWKTKASFHQKNSKFQNASVRGNAKRQLALMRSMARDLGLTPAQSKKLFKSQTIYMPVSTR